MAVSNNDERRKHSRVGFTTAIQILLEVNGKEINCKGSSRDLSLKGIFISTDKKFPSGTKCSIKVCLTGTIDKIELLMKGTVVRITDNGMGIVFDSMDVDTYSHLKNIVHYNSMDDSV
ncbi:MAG: PilZ domain-containing protein [Deltaproteobacteria bacterium]|nr:PilZ domain-containing protein [Deltaproteobacteria bacterium]